MMGFVNRLLTRSAPVVTDARPADAAIFAVLHAQSFRRGWSEQEFQRLLAERNVIAHRASLGRSCAGFILSSLVAGEAEILSVAIAPAYRGHSSPRPLLETHLRRLAGFGARTVFLEVGEQNVPACRLYRRAGFREVGRRQGYYDGGMTALVLRRDLG
jgi:[ribosomal protein S18]-alanine N-acetyltransferase